MMDPLARLKEARLQGVLPDKVCDLVLRRFAGIVVPGIDRIERTTGMAYPAAYVEPAAVISPAAQFGYGVLFARTVPVVVEGDFRVVVQISAPLVAYGLKGAHPRRTLARVPTLSGADEADTPGGPALRRNNGQPL